MSDGQESVPRRAGPTLDQFVALGYVFLFVSIVDAEFAEVLALFGRGVPPGGFSFGILVFAAVAVLGLYFRTAWGLIGSVALFGFYSLVMFYAGELTIAGVAALCMLYLLARADVVLDSEH